MTVNRSGNIANSSQGFSGSTGQINARYRRAPVKQLQAAGSSKRTATTPFSSGAGRDYNRYGGTPEENVGAGAANAVTSLLKTALAVEAFKEFSHDSPLKDVKQPNPQSMDDVVGRTAIGPGQPDAQQRPRAHGSADRPLAHELNAGPKLQGRTGHQPNLADGRTALPAGKQAFGELMAGSAPTFPMLGNALSERAGTKTVSMGRKRPLFAAPSTQPTGEASRRKAGGSNISGLIGRSLVQ